MTTENGNTTNDIVRTAPTTEKPQRTDVRLDTGAIVYSRPMTKEEMEAANQGKLFAIEGGDVEERKGRKSPGANG